MPKATSNINYYKKKFQISFFITAIAIFNSLQIAGSYYSADMKKAVAAQGEAGQPILKALEKNAYLINPEDFKALIDAGKAGLD